MGFMQPILIPLSTALSHSVQIALLMGLWRATWQGAILILAVAAICRIGRRIPAGVRCWLWWLASLKLLISLCSLTAIPLAVLPSSSPIDRTLTRALPVHARIYIPVATPAPARMAHPASATPRVMVTASTAPVSTPAQKTSTKPEGVAIPLWAMPLAFWMLGVVGLLGLSLRSYLSTRRLLRHAQPAG